MSEISYKVGSSKLTYEQLMKAFDEVLDKSLQYTKPIITNWIRKYVAKRTGQLQDSLIERLNLSSYLNNVLKLLLGTKVEYASDVNKMSSKKLKHFNEWGYAYYYGYNGLLKLNDPEALDDFFGNLIKESKRVLIENFNKSKLEVFGQIGVSGDITSTI